MVEGGNNKYSIKEQSKRTVQNDIHALRDSDQKAQFEKQIVRSKRKQIIRGEGL